MDKEKLKQYLKETIKWDLETLFKNWFDKNGILVTQGDMRDGKVLDNTPLIGDLGDYIQYILYSGQLLNEKKYIDWSYEQIFKIAELYQENTGDINLSDKSRYFKVKHREEAGDTMVGLTNFYILTGDKGVYSIFNKYFDYWYDEIVNKKNYSSVQIEVFNCKYGLPYSHPALLGNLAEEVLLIYNKTKEEKYYRFSKKIIDYLLNNYYFKKYNLFPVKIFNSGIIVNNISFLNKIFKFINKAFHKNYGSLLLTMVSKSNSNAASALTELVKVDESYGIYLKKWCESFRAAFFSNGLVNNIFYEPERGKSYGIDLSHYHPAVNNLLDAAIVLKNDELLDFCRKSVDFILTKISDYNLISDDATDKNCVIANVDSNIDFSVLLYKLFEITDEQKYFDTASSIIYSISSRYKTNYGLALSVNPYTGEINDYEQSIKFHTLALKGFCIAYKQLSGVKIKEDEKISCISRDR